MKARLAPAGPGDLAGLLAPVALAAPAGPVALSLHPLQVGLVGLAGLGGPFQPIPFLGYLSLPAMDPWAFTAVPSVDFAWTRTTAPVASLFPRGKGWVRAD